MDINLKISLSGETVGNITVNGEPGIVGHVPSVEHPPTLGQASPVAGSAKKEPITLTISPDVRQAAEMFRSQTGESISSQVEAGLRLYWNSKKPISNMSPAALDFVRKCREVLELSDGLPSSNYLQIQELRNAMESELARLEAA